MHLDMTVGGGGGGACLGRTLTRCLFASICSLSPEFRSLALLYVHADHFINDCAYGSIGFIILDMSCGCIFMYIVYMLRLLLRTT